MTPTDLAHLLAPYGLSPEAPDVLARLEALADRRPGDRPVRTALLAAHAHATAGAGLRPVVAGIRREHLVRWDAVTTTWAGVHVTGGTPALVRVLRPDAARDPLLRRQLAREGRALAALLPVEEDDGALVLPLPGPAHRASPPGGVAGEDAFPGLVARTLAGLERWARAGLPLPDPGPAELRDASDHLVVASLSVVEDDATPAAVATVATALRDWWTGSPDHPVATLLDGLREHPPDHPSEAAERCVATLAELLAETRHRAAAARRVRAAGRQRERLEVALADLEAAVPPPTGRGALGLDLDGHTLVATCDGTSLTWGPAGDEAPIWDPDDGFDVPAARRLVRARGSAPLSERLNREVGGEVRFADAIARWVAAALELRTLRMLLQAGEG